MKKVGLFLGPTLFFAMIAFPPAFNLSIDAWRVIAMAVLMLVWWITEAVPIPVTALLPMVLLPLLQVSTMKVAASPYASPIIFLFMGGFMLALAMEKWSLHRRIALNIVRLTGTNANGIILGFMLATGFLSMWISNTATTVMMLPIAMSVIDIITSGKQDMTVGKIRAFAISLMLGIAYAANIGGTATIVGTPPNVVLAGFIYDTYQYDVSFAKWMVMGVPFAGVLLFITYIVLVRLLFPNRLGEFEGARQLVDDEIAKLGPVSTAEKRVLVIFTLTALAWMLRAQLNSLFGLNPAEGEIIITDHMIALMATVLLFITPANKKNEGFTLAWRDTERLPWGILLLFGGGLSLAAALDDVGLIDLIGRQFEGGSTVGFWVIVGLTTVSLFLTEVMSNVALVTVFLPVVGGVALGLDFEPLLFCIPVTLAASCAFMFPISTPPNAIVFASGYIRMTDMARAGIILNILAIALIALLTQFVLPMIF